MGAECLVDKVDRIVNAKENEMGVTILKPKGGKEPIKFEFEKSAARGEVGCEETPGTALGSIAIYILQF